MKSSTATSQPKPSSSWGAYWELTRLHKFPLGDAAAFFPFVWGLTMVAYRENLLPKNYWLRVLYFSVGATVLHSATCVINDICDVDFDRQVERTKTRPLVTGRATILGAWVLVALIVAPLVWMFSYLNTTAFSYALITIFPLHGLYPLMKRWTWWPSAWLGLAFGMGIIIAWTSVARNLQILSPPVILLAGSVCWGIIYDSIYACQDREDDIQAGVKSTALLFGDKIRYILIAFSAALVFSLLVAGWLNRQGLGFYILSVGGSIVYFIWQFSVWDENNVEQCASMFKSHNYHLGSIIWSGLLLDYVLA